MKGGEHYSQIFALDAIMRIDPVEGLVYAITELRDEKAEVRRNAVITCIQSGDRKVIEPLKKLYRDNDFEVRFYARQGVKRLSRG